jgi:aspartate/methionine/tyrosine aminotransferase
MAVMNAIVQLPRTVFPRANDAPEMVIPMPNYPVCAAQPLHTQALTPRFIQAREENGFLPTFDEIVATVTDRTVQITLTYPNNPAQATYKGKSFDELRKLVRYCKKNAFSSSLTISIKNLFMVGPLKRYSPSPIGLIIS